MDQKLTLEIEELEERIAPHIMVTPPMGHVGLPPSSRSLLPYLRLASNTLSGRQLRPLLSRLTMRESGSGLLPMTSSELRLLKALPHSRPKSAQEIPH